MDDQSTHSKLKEGSLKYNIEALQEQDVIEFLQKRQID